jgi:hypothetical protein
MTKLFNKTKKKEIEEENCVNTLNTLIMKQCQSNFQSNSQNYLILQSIKNLK